LDTDFWNQQQDCYHHYYKNSFIRTGFFKGIFEVGVEIIWRKGGNGMLTAHTKTGLKICLGNYYSKETLLELRKKEEFICPICGENVILKLGNQRIFHFSHKKGSTCHKFFESETMDHMEGKLQLYQWLTRQKIPCRLEYYDKEIKQRPDILFKFNGRKFALEYQCSTISESVFEKRTKTYLENDYIPLWILSSNHLKRKGNNVISLSNFSYLFLRKSSIGDYIPAYCPEKKQFHFIESLFPYSIKNVFAQYSIYPLEKMNINTLLAPPKKWFVLEYATWARTINHFTLKWALHSNAAQDPFLKEIYSRNLNIFLLPPEIGLPLPHSYYLQTSPVKWQTYLYLDVISRKHPGETITLQEIQFHVNKRMKRNEIVIRKLPQLNEINPMVPVMEYFRELIKLNIFIRTGDTTCQVKRKIIIPTTEKEKKEAQEFFKGIYKALGII
jgi:competence protein CoiA